LEGKYYAARKKFRKTVKRGMSRSMVYHVEEARRCRGFRLDQRWGEGKGKRAHVLHLDRTTLLRIGGRREGPVRTRVDEISGKEVLL